MLHCFYRQSVLSSRIAYSSFFFVFLFWPSISQADLTTPLAVINQSPLVQIYGLPDMGRSSLLTAGDLETRLVIDVSSHFIVKTRNNESLRLDGESYRYSLGLDYGFSNRLELGMEIPYVTHKGGQLDGFINDWHDFFGLPTNGRENAPKDQLNFSYSNNGTEVLSLQEKVEGIGDLRLRAAWQVSRRTENAPTAVALRGSLKLPTGDSERLTGSGGTDLALWLTSGRQYSVAWGDLGLMASLGVLLLGDGKVLKDQQRQFACFGGIAVAFQPWRHVKLQAQLDSHSSLYRNSQLQSIDSAAALLTTGGTVMLDSGHELEIAVVEDIAVGTAPDVVFHLAWRKRY